MGLSNTLFLPLAKKFIAGETLSDAIEVCRSRNSAGISGMINILGEHTSDEEKIKSYVAEYLLILKQIKKENIDSSISVKPSQLGIDLGLDYCKNNLIKLLTEASKHDNFVWVDMEDSPYTDDTISLFLDVKKEFSNMGLCVQAYLKRTEDDLNQLLSANSHVRLCKGAYNESDDVVYKKNKTVVNNFEILIHNLFNQGTDFAIATHDDKLIDLSIKLHNSTNVPFEFQMLLGVRDKKKSELISQGHKVTEYIPYGKEWLPYSIRRLNERKRNIFLLARAFIP